VEERFAPGTYCNLTQAEALNRPTFDVHDAGGVLASPPAAKGPTRLDMRQVQVITILDNAVKSPARAAGGIDLSATAALIGAARRPPKLSDAPPSISTGRERWTTVSGPRPAPVLGSATAAHQDARVNGGVAVAERDAANPVDLSAL
jgi:hypothetical protein